MNLITVDSFLPLILEQSLDMVIFYVIIRDGISDNRYIGKPYIGFFVNIGYRYRLKSYQLNIGYRQKQNIGYRQIGYWLGSYRY